MGVEPNSLRPRAVRPAMNYRLKGLGPLLPTASPPCRTAASSAWRWWATKVGLPTRLARRLGIADVVPLPASPPTARAYFAADLLVHPTFYDPCSLVVREAQACGLPSSRRRYQQRCELLGPPHDRSGHRRPIWLGRRTGISSARRRRSPARPPSRAATLDVPAILLVALLELHHNQATKRT
ncbi:MAG: hypothetical protein U0736_15385 [Gemmataceae bacterium]